MTPKQKRKVNFVRGQGFNRLLRRRIELSKNKCASVDQLAVYLRSTYLEYTRHKLEPFSKGVQQILEQMGDHTNEEYDDERTPPRRRRAMKVGEAEEKLWLLEEKHSRKRTGRINDDFENGAGSTSSMASAAINGTSESESDNLSEETKDAFYEET